MKVSQIFNVIYIVFTRLRDISGIEYGSLTSSKIEWVNIPSYFLSQLFLREFRDIFCCAFLINILLTCLLILCLVPWRIFRCDFHSRPCKCLRHANICTRLPVASRFSLSLSITPCPSTSFHGSFRKPSPDADEERQ